MNQQPLHTKVADDLRKQISSGDLAPGEKIPSEAALGEDYQVSRVTVRHALRTLEQEGLIVAKSGVGRIVKVTEPMVYRPQAERDPRISSTLDRYMSYLINQGRTPSQTIEIAIEPAPEPVARRFRIEPGTSVVVRKRIRWLDGEPFNINDTYYLRELAEGTEVADPADIPRGSNTVIEEIIGSEVLAIDDFYVRMPTPDEARRLEIGAGTPVAVHYVTGLTADDKIVRVEYFVLPGDRHIIQFERHHGGANR
ncbi:GntR family transcriptional regulator [Saccharopolyspora sp. NPDC000359]|uniref:GntR family transcriptional regulator n=1 Tax=Saccharopolyspora sp. NPDC000359 TaxID=3154251 RepID=UPI003323E9BA